MGEDVKSHLQEADEIWHAGDIGEIAILESLQSFEKPLRIVYGNIDDKEMRNLVPRDEIFTCEGLQVYMTHIGGYPGRYIKRVKSDLEKNPPGLYICGHSHILKVMPDKEIGLLHMNPGACGIVGFHKYRTLLRFEIDQGKISNLNAIELGLRSTVTIS